jgi:hypothetical protein
MLILTKLSARIANSGYFERLYNWLKTGQLYEIEFAKLLKNDA